jgi:hypothetical protein
VPDPPVPPSGDDPAGLPRLPSVPQPSASAAKSVQIELERSLIPPQVVSADHFRGQTAAARKIYRGTPKKFENAHIGDLGGEGAPNDGSWRHYSDRNANGRYCAAIK